METCRNFIAVMETTCCDLQDFHCSDGNKLLSAGMDHSIKIWDLAGVLAHVELVVQV